MQQGIYREGGVAGGLPLPRTRLGLLTGLVLFFAFGAVVLPFVVFAGMGGSPADAWRRFKEGGGSMYLLLLLELGVPIVVGVLGIFVARGKKIPTAILFAAAALPLFIALLGAYSGMRLVIGAIAGESVDPEQKARILAAGVSESMSCDVYGGLVATGAAIAACVACASAAATIDATRAAGGAKPSSFGALGSAACGAAWLLATIVIGFLRARSTGPLILVSVLVVASLVPFAILGGRGAAILRGWHDRAEAARASGALFVAMLGALLAVLAFERAIDAAATSRAFGAISGESIDDSQRARILAEALSATALAPASYVAHAVLGTATFALALAPSIGRGPNGATRHPLGAGPAVALGVGIALLAATLGLWRSRANAAEVTRASGRSSAPPGVTLPVLVEAFSNKGAGGTYGVRVVVAKDGSGETEKTTSSYGAPRFVVYADRAATIDMVRARLPKDSAGAKLTFVAERRHPPGLDEQLGDLAGFLGTTGYVGADLDDLGAARRGSDVLDVRSIADDAVEIDGKRVAFPPPEVSGDGDYSPRIERIQYHFRDSDSVEHALRIVTAVENFHRARLSYYQLERTMELGARPPPPAPPATTSARPPPPRR